MCISCGVCSSHCHIICTIMFHLILYLYMIDTLFGSICFKWKCIPQIPDNFCLIAISYLYQYICTWWTYCCLKVQEIESLSVAPSLISRLIRWWFNFFWPVNYISLCWLSSVVQPPSYYIPYNSIYPPWIKWLSFRRQNFLIDFQ